MSMKAMKTYRCKCGFAVSGGHAIKLRDRGVHRNALGYPDINNGVLYCPICDDETLVEQPPLTPVIDPWSAELATRNRRYLESQEFRDIAGRVLAARASRNDLLDYVAGELREAMDCLEPMAPKNGRDLDGYHAANCILRAWAVLTCTDGAYGARLYEPREANETGAVPSRAVASEVPSPGGEK